MIDSDRELHLLSGEREGEDLHDDGEEDDGKPI
jgi:hypothetical protein